MIKFLIKLIPYHMKRNRIFIIKKLFIQIILILNHIFGIFILIVYTKYFITDFFFTTKVIILANFIVLF